MDWQPIILTCKIALTVCAILLVIGTPAAYWLAFTERRWKFMAEALTAAAVPRRVTAADTLLQAKAEAGAIQLPAATAAEADRHTVAAEGRRIATAVDRMVDVDISTALDSWPA